MINLTTNEISGESCHIGYYPNCFNQKFIKIAKNYCLNQKDFQEGVSGWGKPIPRLQKWYQTNGESFSKNWKTNFKRWQSFSYDSTLLYLQNKINQETNKIITTQDKPKFNSCLLNFYRNGEDSIKPHFDSTDLFGNTPTISILSIGASREIVFSRRDYNPKNPKSLKLDKENQNLNLTINLEEGSLLIMSQATQKYYVHEIPKNSEILDKRYSLTFREFL